MPKVWQSDSISGAASASAKSAMSLVSQSESEDPSGGAIPLRLLKSADGVIEHLPVGFRPGRSAASTGNPGALPVHGVIGGLQTQIKNMRGVMALGGNPSSG